MILINFFGEKRAKVTLYEGPSVVFVGLVEEDQSVIDLLSAQMEDAGDFEAI